MEKNKGEKGENIKMSKISIVYKNIDELIPYINNPRNNDHAVDYVASSIKNFGFKVPVVIDSNNEIITGHTRIKASAKLGLKEIPCIIADDLNEAQIKAFRLADNKVSEYSDWDLGALELELECLSLEDFDMEFFGFEIDSQNESEDFLDINYEGYDTVQSDRLLRFANKRINITEEEENELLRVYDDYVEKHGVDIGFAKGLINGF